MWQEDYVGSLIPPLPEALGAMAPSSELLGISLVPNHTEKWDRSFAAGIVGSVPSLLEVLQETGLPLLLSKFGILATRLQTAGLLFPPKEWTREAFAGGFLEPLAPLSLLLAHLTPWGRYYSLWALHVFLKEVEGDTWEGPTCVRYLAIIQQHLEDLQPGKVLNWLEGLQDFLAFQQSYLMWLACHPEVCNHRGCDDFALMLLTAKETMDLKMEYYSKCLINLQLVLENLNEVEAIVPSLDDLDLY